MSRRKKILLSGFLALGFLVLRLSYAFVFAGLAGGQVILSLPEIRLAGPFSHVRLFGEVGVDGIIRNLETAIPFALSILLFGIVASFITPQNLRVLANKIPAIRNLVSAIAIGLNSLPALFEASRKVVEARQLRGEKRSQLLVPILERSVELANAIGMKLALEPAGNQRARSLSVHELAVPDCNLGPVSFQVSAGQIMVLSGATGSGKSTLLEAIAGILSEYRGREVSGDVKFDGKSSLSIAEIANFLRYIPQNPRELIWGFDVAELVTGTPAHLSQQLGLSKLPKSTQHLSEGEALKLLLAENLSCNPTILLLDEPYSPLDSESRPQLTAILNDLAAKGMAVVVVEHEPKHTSGLIAERVQLVAGQLMPGQYQPEPPQIQRTPVLVGSENVVTAVLEDIDFGRLLVKAPTLKLKQGELVWLAGENGSGKSSLLESLAKGDGVLVHGQKLSRAKQLVLVPENFEDFFVTDSLNAELERADRVAGVQEGFTRTTLEAILPSEQIASWLSVHPRDLSRGTRLALAIAMQLSHKPQALLVDEPFRGLDVHARELMVESLRCVAETGCAVLFASHERSWSEALASRRLEITNQQLRESTEVSA